MSASFSSTPGTILAPAHCNKLWFTATGYNSATEYKFRYVFDVYIDGVAVVRLLKVPDSGSDDATFDLRGILKNRMYCDPEATTDDVLMLFPTEDVSGLPMDTPSAGTEALKIEVKVGRSYASSADGNVSISADEDTHTLYVFNGSIQYPNTSTIPDVYACGASTDRMLSNRTPNTYRMRTRDGAFAEVGQADIQIPVFDDAYYVLSFLNDDGTYLSGHNAQHIEYQICSNAGALAHPEILSISPSFGATVPTGTTDGREKIVRFGCGPANVNAWDSGFFNVSGPPSSVTNWSYYRVRLLAAALDDPADGTATDKLIDSAATFITDGVQVGDTVFNTTDTTWATVTAVDSETQLSLSDDIFVSGESYEIYRASSRWYVFLNMDRALSCNYFHSNVGALGDRERFQVAWVNGRGGWEFFDFTAVASLDWKVSRKEYRRSITDQQEPWESDHRRYSQIDAEKVWKLRTRWLDYGELTLLRFLVHSPQVYLIRLDGSPLVQPVLVETSSFDEPLYSNMKIRDFQIQLRVASSELIPVR